MLATGLICFLSLHIDGMITLFYGIPNLPYIVFCPIISYMEILASTNKKYVLLEEMETKI